MRHIILPGLLLLALCAPASAADGVGALGRLEPRSRVVRVSHDLGPEGARIEQMLVAEGQDVKAGERLAVFSDYPRKQAKAAEAAAQVAILQARLEVEEVNLKYADKDYKRKRQLERADAVSQNNLEQSERDWKAWEAGATALKAEVDAAKARQALSEEELKRSVLLAPIDGTVLKILSRPGERAGDGGIVEIADLANFDVVAEVYERDMTQVKAGQKAEIRVPGIEGAINGTVRELGYQVMKNDLNSTDPLADRDNRTVETRISLDGAAAEKLKHLIYMKVDVRILP